MTDEEFKLWKVGIRSMIITRLIKIREDYRDGKYIEDRKPPYLEKL